MAALARGDLFSIACHDKGGCFVMGEAILAAGPAEVVALGPPLVGRAQELGWNRGGVHVLAKITMRLVRYFKP